jgi:hypothetical protein
VAVADDGVPDIEWAKKRIPIPDVARELGLEIAGRMIRCWRPERHQHGDRTPSVGIQLRANRAKCFVCDGKRLSTVDLVMSVLRLRTFEAVLWLAERFDIPRIPKGKNLPLRARNARPYRVGVSGSRLEQVIRSGLFAGMSHAETRILITLDGLAERETDSTTISYAGLRTYSGIRKDSTISNALKRLENMHAMEIMRGRSGDGLARCNAYRLTLEDCRFVAQMNDCEAATRGEIEAQRLFRAQRRARRVRSRQPQPGNARQECITGITSLPLKGVRRNFCQGLISSDTDSESFYATEAHSSANTTGGMLSAE